MPVTKSDIKSLKLKQNSFKHKFGAVRCERDNIKFPSKLERAVYDELVRLRKKGDIIFFLRQIPFDLPGGYKHFVDFLIFVEQNCYFIEVKGRDLSLGKLKREQVEDIYNLTIHVVRHSEEVEIILLSK